MVQPLYSSISGLVSAAVAGETLGEHAAQVLGDMNRVDVGNPLLPAIDRFKPRLRPLFNDRILQDIVHGSRVVTPIEESSLLMGALGLTDAMDALLGNEPHTRPSGVAQYFEERGIPYRPTPVSSFYSLQIGPRPYENDQRKPLTYETYVQLLEESDIFQREANRESIEVLNLFIEIISDHTTSDYYREELPENFPRVPVSMASDFAKFTEGLHDQSGRIRLPDKLKDHLKSREFYEVLEQGVNLPNSGFSGTLLALLDLFVVVNDDILASGATKSAYMRPTFETFSQLGYNNYFVYFVDAGEQTNRFSYNQQPVAQRFMAEYPIFYDLLSARTTQIYLREKKGVSIDWERLRLVDRAFYVAWNIMAQYPEAAEESLSA